MGAAPMTLKIGGMSRGTNMLKNILNNLRNYLEARKQFYTLSYHGLKLKLPYNPRAGKCQVCDREGYTNIHHTCYNFTYGEVRKDTKLALMFTYEVCYGCHELSNSTRKLMFEDLNLEVSTSNPKLKKIVDFHKKLLKERDQWNKKHRKDT